MNNKSKTLLFAALIAAMILPFSGMGIAEAKSNNNTDYDKLSSQIDKEIDKFVKQSEKFSDNPEKLAKLNEKYADKQEQLITKYQKKMDKGLSKSGQGYTNMTIEQQNDMISLIISEKFKEPMREKFVSDMIAKEQGISVLGFELLPSAYAGCSTQPNVYKFKQLNLDIIGTTGFHGHNDLETVKRVDLSSCLREYTLTFTDEDHPLVDEWYDGERLKEYGRIKDIEKFYVSNDKVWFLDSGSKGQSFYSIGFHYQDVNSFSNTVYVSNTWNHMMDTSNTNPGKTIKTWYK